MAAALQMPIPSRRMRFRRELVVLALILLGAIRIVSTYHVFSATVDEATHVGAGLELWESHTYVLQTYNPPLPRLIWSYAPWRSGMRFVARGSYADWLLSVFYGHGDYKANVARSRAGNLVFFVLAALGVWLAARDALGDDAAVVAVLLFTMEPVILGYSGIVNHDTPGVAGLALSIAAFFRWLRRPDLRHGALLGAAYAFAILCKFSNILYVPAVWIALYAVRFATEAETRAQFRQAALSLITAVVTTCLGIWAGYAFSVGKPGDLSEQARVGLGRLFARLPASTPLPAPRFFDGVGGLLGLDKQGFLSYFFGKASEGGFVWYFPAALGLKTTLALLALVIAGAVFARRRALEWLIAAAAILLPALHTTLDLGIRYILPIYVPLVLAASAGAVALWQSGKRGLRGAAIALVACQIAASGFAHPDYFPYFNVLAGRDPSRSLIDSNLDWGQDVLRLRSAIRKQHIPSIGLSLMGLHDFDKLGFPPHHDASPFTPAHGWLAVSDHSYRMTQAHDGGWQWLEGKAYQRVGKSIRLYQLP